MIKKAPIPAKKNSSRRRPTKNEKREKIAQSCMGEVATAMYLDVNSRKTNWVHLRKKTSGTYPAPERTKCSKSRQKRSSTVGEFGGGGDGKSE